MGTFIKNHNSSKDEKLTFLDLTVSACLGSAVRLRGVTLVAVHLIFPSFFRCKGR